MQPMLATPGALPEGPEWLFEVKWDGLRVLAEVVDGRVRLTDDTERDVTAVFPELAELTRLAPDVVLDGDVVLLAEGVPSAAALAERLAAPVGPGAPPARPVTFMVTDVLRLYGVPLLERPQEERRGTLERLDLSGLRNVQVSPVYADGAALLQATAQREMEGVLAKRRDVAYAPGVRTAGWVEVTHRRTEAFLVGGWCAARSGPPIAALLVGLPDGGRLRYAGRVDAAPLDVEVAATLRERLRRLGTDGPPFAERIPRAEATGVRWCAPQVAVAVDHLGPDRAGRPRRPVVRAVLDGPGAPTHGR